MRIRMRRKPCTRCHHYWEIHDMKVAGLEGDDVRVPCGYMVLVPAWGNLMMLRACDCPGYVAPAPAGLKLANRVLANVRNPRWWLAFVLAVVIWAFLVLPVVWMWTGTWANPIPGVIGISVVALLSRTEVTR